MRFLLIHQAFVGPGEAGGTRHWEFARACVERGHRFAIVASDRNYLSGAATVAREGWVTEQTVEGVRVLRAYTYPSLHRSFAWRIVSFLSFMVTSVLAALRAGPVDVVMGTSPPIFQALSAWLVAALRRRPLLLEIRDLWPEFAVEMGVLRNPLLIAASRGLERFLYARAAHLLVNSPAYRDYLLGKGVAPAKISLIPNGVDPAMFDPTADGAAQRAAWGLDGKFVVCYAGALGLANDIPTLLKAADLLRDQPDVHFLLVGDGKERPTIEKRVQTLALPNVTLTGSVPKSAMRDVLAAADSCVAILKDIPLFRTTYPNKVFDYMAAGRPTILAIDGVIRQVVEAAGGGLFVPPGDARALADAVLRLSQDRAAGRAMGRAARAHVEAHFNRADQAGQFAALLEGLVTPPPRLAQRLYRHVGKRAFDLVVAGLALLFLAPLLLLVSLLIGLETGRPLFFTQERLGQDGRTFRLYKFRSMVDRPRAASEIFGRSPDVTRVGYWLRRSKIDELPQLLNVLRGDMSLVGPRPALPAQLAELHGRARRRLAVRPGLTGLAQVKGNIHLSWPERWWYDALYVERVSLRSDLWIVWRTLLVVLLGEARFVQRPPVAAALDEEQADAF